MKLALFVATAFLPLSIGEKKACPVSEEASINYLLTDKEIKEYAKLTALILKEGQKEKQKDLLDEYKDKIIVGQSKLKDCLQKKHWFPSIWLNKAVSATASRLIEAGALDLASYLITTTGACNWGTELEIDRLPPIDSIAGPVSEAPKGFLNRFRKVPQPRQKKYLNKICRSCYLGRGPLLDFLCKKLWSGIGSFEVNREAKEKAFGDLANGNTHMPIYRVVMAFDYMIDELKKLDEKKKALELELDGKKKGQRKMEEYLKNERCLRIPATFLIKGYLNSSEGTIPAALLTYRGLCGVLGISKTLSKSEVSTLSASGCLGQLCSACAEQSQSLKRECK